MSADFPQIARESVDELLAADPVTATWLGDHRFDDRLPDLSAEWEDGFLRRLDDHITALDAVDDLVLDVEEQVDLEILRARLLRTQFEFTELRAHTWNPMLANPGTALHLLISRDFAPVEERAQSANARLRDTARFLGQARDRLEEPMPAIHVETAIAQLGGARTLITDELPRALGDSLDIAAQDAARDAIDVHLAWLQERLPHSNRSPRLNARTYAGVLWHTLDDATNANKLLQAAEDHLDHVTEQMREAASTYLGESPHAKDVVRRALDRIAAQSSVNDATVLPLVEAALARTTNFTRTHDLVTIPDLDTRVIVMPEIHRGVAVAYCDAPGPLESASVPTYVAVAPTPTSWSPERIESFYREYNATLIHDLTIHEAMPGHVLQLAHAQRVRTSTPVRRFGFSGVFVEGWAVYAEELMIERGYAPDDTESSRHAIRLQQLKMQARMCINTILDIRVHSMDMTEEEGMSLMHWRGFQEEGEATGKWRRALLTAGQLPTYFVGYQAVKSIANDLRVLHPEWTDRQIHDLMLQHGSPAPRHLRTLIGI